MYSNTNHSQRHRYGWYGHLSDVSKKFLAVVLNIVPIIVFRETFLLSRQHAPPAPISLMRQTLTHTLAMAFGHMVIGAVSP